MNKSDHFLFFCSRREKDSIILDENESHHARNVLRCEAGRQILATDGKGTVFTCIIEAFSKSECACRIQAQKQYSASKAPLWFFIGLPDRTCFEYALEGLVPLGVNRIIPLECEYCQKGWWKHDWEKHARRFQEKIIVAGKQSYNPYFPVLDAPNSFADAAQSLPETVMIADETGRTLDKIIITLSGPVACFIGPPGGFSPQELDRLKNKKTQLVRLGNNRLRTELAALTFAAQLALFIN